MTNQEKMMMKQDGFTLFEMLITIIVGTIVITMLMQMLVMVLDARRQFETETTMVNESYYISEQIRNNIFILEPHSITLISDTATETVIHIVHEYDVRVDGNNILYRDDSNPITDILTYDKVNEELRYERGATGNDRLLHDANIKILTGSSISIIPINPDFCAIFPNDDICDDGILELNLIIAIEVSGGGRFPSQTFVSTIIV
jgi:prepilin-type N-terminal cleavage/methylation domain-containing protein